jgi:hypothetical protein
VWQARRIDYRLETEGTVLLFLRCSDPSLVGTFAMLRDSRRLSTCSGNRGHAKSGACNDIGGITISSVSLPRAVSAGFVVSPQYKQPVQLPVRQMNRRVFRRIDCAPAIEL